MGALLNRSLLENSGGNWISIVVSLAQNTTKKLLLSQNYNLTRNSLRMHFFPGDLTRAPNISVVKMYVFATDAGSLQISAPSRKGERV